MLLLLITLTSVALVSSHEYYQTRIPNGNSVPDPCGSGIWRPVGHYSPEHHTHDKNPFGKAFAAAGHMWTVALCGLDSDGDGSTNGEELGDPNCVWTVGSTPTNKAIGHPGICDALGTAACSHETFYCNCHGHSCVG